MKQKTHFLFFIVAFSFFVVTSCALLFLRHNLLYESTLLDNDAIRLFACSATLTFLVSLLLIRNSTIKKQRRMFVMYSILLIIAIFTNEYFIDKKQNPEILLTATQHRFLDGRKLYLRDDKSYKAEESDLLSARFSYGTYLVRAETLFLTPCNAGRSFLQGEFLYMQGEENSSTVNGKKEFLQPFDGTEEAYDEPLLIESNHIFGK